VDSHWSKNVHCLLQPISRLYGLKKTELYFILFIIVPTGWTDYDKLSNRRISLSYRLTNQPKAQVKKMRFKMANRNNSCIIFSKYV